MDDIFVYGDTKEEHDRTVKVVLDKFNRHDVVLNLEKCVFGVEEIEIIGHKFTKDGFIPSDKKICDLMSCRAPTSKEELSSFLGLIGYVARFIPDCSTKTSKLRELNKLGSVLSGPRNTRLLLNF